MYVCTSVAFIYLTTSLGMKVPAVIHEAEKSLEEGYCVVIGLQTTGEVSIARIYLTASVIIERQGSVSDHLVS